MAISPLEAIHFLGLARDPSTCLQLVERGEEARTVSALVLVPHVSNLARENNALALYTPKHVETQNARSGGERTLKQTYAGYTLLNFLHHHLRFGM